MRFRSTAFPKDREIAKEMRAELISGCDTQVMRTGP